MKQILYILNDNARRFTYARCASLYQAIQTADEIINLFIMRSDGHIRFSQEHNRGEYNIFHLPEYRDYDAVILDLNSNFSAGSNIYGAKGALYAIEAARASGKPVLSVANDIPSFYYIGIDNHAAMTSVIQYLHEEEGLTDFWFAMGPADNYENLQRTEALRDYCAAHGISCGEDRFYSESFVLKSGTHAFHTLLKSHNGCLPQAVICANDLIAMGVSSAAETLGFRIPEDFRVTGFDNINVSGYLSPSLTTVDQMCWRFGDVALNALIRKWRGETIPHNIITPTRLVLRESTGHHELSQTDVKSHAGRLIIEDFEVDDFGYAISAMQHKLPGCKTIEDICMVLTECLAALGCKGCQLVLDRELFEYVSLSGFNQQAERGLDVSGELSVDGYSDRMEIVFTWMVGRKPLFEHFHVSAKLQTEQFPGAKENHLFIPLHFMEHTVGYLSIWNCLEMIRIKCVSSYRTLQPAWISRPG